MNGEKYFSPDDSPVSKKISMTLTVVRDHTLTHIQTVLASEEMSDVGDDDDDGGGGCSNSAGGDGGNDASAAATATAHNNDNNNK